MKARRAPAGATLFFALTLLATEVLPAPAERPAPNDSAAAEPPSHRIARAGETARWQEIQKMRRPTRIVALCKAFQRDFPKSAWRDEAKAIEAGAFRAMMIKRDIGLTGDFFETAKGDAAFNANLLAAARGDADAAHLVARAFADGKSGIPANKLRHRQLLHFAAELGHPGASWEMAQLYNLDGRIGEAAHFESRAISLGYKPPPRLSNRDY